MIGLRVEEMETSLCIEEEELTTLINDQADRGSHKGSASERICCEEEERLRQLFGGFCGVFGPRRRPRCGVRHDVDHCGLLLFLVHGCVYVFRI